MSKIQTATIGTEGSSEFRQFGFQKFGFLELHLNCLKSKLATFTVIQHLNTICKYYPFGGSGLKRMLYYASQLSLFIHCLKSKLKVPFRFFRVLIADRKKCLKSKISGNRTQLSEIQTT